MAASSKLPDYIERIRAHLVSERGMSGHQATAVAIKTAQDFCSSGQSPNLPVTVGAGARAEACAAVSELQAAKAAKVAKEEPVAEKKEEPVAEKATGAAWDGSPSRFTDEQYARACVLDRGPSVASVKERYSLPVREPDGTLSRAGVHSAASMISKVKAPADVLAKAARALVALYRELGEEPPESLVKLAGAAAVAGAAASAAHSKAEQRDLAEMVEERSAPEDAPPPRLVGNKLVGLIPYGVESRDLGGWKERLAPGCLSGAAKESLVATLNHDVSKLLGRYPTTLTTEDRDDGLAWECELPNGPTGQDVREAVARGDLNGTSWRMIVGRDRWEGDLRVVEEIRELRDVAVVTHPAYPTAVELRSRPEPRPASPEQEEERTMETEVVPEEQEEDRSEPGGGLRIEDRATEPVSETGAAGIEDRVVDAMRSIPKGEQRSLTEADNAAAVTPPQLSTYLWDKLRDKAVLLASGVPTLTTSNKEIKWPRLVSDIDVEFYAEADPITESDPGFDTFDITPKAIKGLVIGSSEAFEDSSPDLLTILRQNLEVVMALKLDREALVGDGTGNGFVGLANITGISTIDAADSMDNYDLILRAMGVLAGKHIPGPYAWVTHPWVETALALKKTLTGSTIDSNEPLPRPDGVPAPFTTTQIGHDDTAHTSSILVYSPSHLRIVRRVDTEILVDRSAEFETDQIAVRGRLRATLFVPYPEAVCLIENVPAPDPESA
jgi:HK97 family phage major capsid protein/HK97 family phage prohead protease